MPRPPGPRSQRPIAAYVDLVAAMITVGSIVPASKLISAALPPFLAGALRLCVAAAVLVPLSLVRGGARLPRLDRHDGLLLLLQAAAGTVGFTVFMILGTQRTTATDASVVAGTLPVVSVLVAALVLRERPPRGAWAAATIAAVALVMLQAPGTSDGAQRAAHLAGNALVLAAVASESLFILLQKRLHRPLAPLGQATTMVVLGLVLLALPASREASAVDLSSVPLVSWLATVYYGLVPTVAGFYLWYRGAARVPAAIAGVFSAVMPVAGAVLSALVLAEPLQLRHAAALALVVVALLTVALPGSRDAPRGEPGAERGDGDRAQVR